MENSVFNRAADNLRVLIASMVEKAKSGHPGGAMGAADFLTVLYGKYLRFDPQNNKWASRDRFFLDPGHMSTMLYGILAMTGNYTMEELAQFRQWGSVTPGHPELDPERGVENTSGPLGQGHVMAVGCAIAERFMTQRFGETFAHKTYAFISDGGIQEEISQGAGRLAGTLGLSNLIMYYDANEVQLSTKVNEVTNEDTAAKYRSWNWNVIEINGNNATEICNALDQAIAETQRPTLIIGHSVMAKGAVKPDGSSLEGAVSTHGQPLSKAGGDIAKTIEALGGDPANPFQIWSDVKELFAQRKQELTAIVQQVTDEQAKWAAANPDLAAVLQQYRTLQLPQINWDMIEFKANMAARNASAVILGELAKKVGNMIVSSADLANSDKTDGFLKNTRALTAADFGGQFLQAGVAELTMAALMNGIVLHGDMFAACGTFFVFSDYVKPALRISALMELPVKYIFTHDSFRVGEDGPTHEPIEQEAQVRLLEQMNNFSGNMSALVMRPADSAETLVCWKMAMENSKSPSVLILSRQDLPDLKPVSGDRKAEAYGAQQGGYIVKDVANPQLTLVANGSEVALAIDVAQQLDVLGVPTRVASFPSIGLFMRQSQEYRDSVLIPGGKRFGITAGLPATLQPLMKGTAQWDIRGMERFGASAPYKVLDEKFGYTTDSALEEVKKFLGL